MRFSVRLADGDLVYMSFWLLVMGSGLGAILWVMIRIEKNTRAR
jgi:hypothetical protein